LLSREKLRSIVASLKDFIDVLTEQQLMTIFERCVSHHSTSARLSRVLGQIRKGRVSKKDLEAFVNNRPSRVDDLLNEEDQEEGGAEGSSQKQQGTSLSNDSHKDELELASGYTSPSAILNAVEHGVKMIQRVRPRKAKSAPIDEHERDEAAVRFLACTAIANLWRSAYVDEARAVVEAEGYGPSGEYGKEVKNKFLQQYYAARRLTIPKGYAFEEPYLMQLHFASRLLEDECSGLANWSGTGAGKTLSAILAAAKLGGDFVVICPKSTLKQWKHKIEQYFPNRFEIFTGKEEVLNREAWSVEAEKQRAYLVGVQILQKAELAEELIENIVSGGTEGVQLIVLDEIQDLKERRRRPASTGTRLPVEEGPAPEQGELGAGATNSGGAGFHGGAGCDARAEKKLSMRRRQGLNLVSKAREANPDIRVMGTTATPVINDPSEAVSLLEMIDPECNLQKQLDCEKNKTWKCLLVHQYMVLSGELLAWSMLSQCLTPFLAEEVVTFRNGALTLVNYWNGIDSIEAYLSRYIPVLYQYVTGLTLANSIDLTFSKEHAADHE
jgi:hypothetical protein